MNATTDEVILTDEEGRRLVLRQIPHEPGYYIDQYGQFWSKKKHQRHRRQVGKYYRNRVHRDHNGRLMMIWVCASSGHKVGYALARLVLQLHVAPCPDPSDRNWHPEYIDGNRRNCAASNLRWRWVAPRSLWGMGEEALGF